MSRAGGKKQQFVIWQDYKRVLIVHGFNYCTSVSLSREEGARWCWWWWGGVIEASLFSSVWERRRRQLGPWVSSLTSAWHLKDVFRTDKTAMGTTVAATRSERRYGRCQPGPVAVSRQGFRRKLKQCEARSLLQGRRCFVTFFFDPLKFARRSFI